MSRNTIGKIFGTIVILVIIVIVFVIANSKPTAENIYYSNINSIVEFKASTESVGESFGTAEFIDEQGTLITNAHIITYKKLGTVHLFEEYAIRFANEDDYREVELIKYDVELDIAVLKIVDDTIKVKPLKIGDSSKLKSGNTVYAIGNTINYGLSISKGIIGIPLLNVTYEGVQREVIQCDLTIAEGNSGGALLNEYGWLIGITTFRTKDSYGNVIYGIAYCIPINVIIDYVNAQA